METVPKNRFYNAVLIAFAFSAGFADLGRADDYAYKPADPQPTGWPLTAKERAFVLRQEYERRPARSR
jgi:hypothetical protein